jgi:hypothetical protein
MIQAPKCKASRSAEATSGSVGGLRGLGAVVEYREIPV